MKAEGEDDEDEDPAREWEYIPESVDTAMGEPERAVPVRWCPRIPLREPMAIAPLAGGMSSVD